MKRLFVQSDDYGFTRGITDGTIHAIKNGIVKNTGIFINMPCVEYAVERIKEVDVCFGIDINLLAGYPVTDPKLIPHLVNEDGHFKSSRQLLKENKLLSVDKYIYNFETDPFVYEETLLETENQVKRFIELVGRKPEYVNSHSIMTRNSEDAGKEIQEKYGIPGLSSNMYFGEDIDDIGFLDVYEPMTLEQQLNNDTADFLIKHIFPKIREDRVAYYGCHCGYIDRELIKETSLTIQRMNDASAVCDERVINYIKENDIELITYRDL